MEPAARESAVLGAADGVILVMGVAMGMAAAHQGPAATWHASLSDGVAEFTGMGAAVWLSRPGSFLPALACGIACLAATVIPAVPFLFLTGHPALAACAALSILAGAAIVWLRPERGFRAIAQTYGLLTAAAGMCFLAGLI